MSQTAQLNQPKTANTNEPAQIPDYLVFQHAKERITKLVKVTEEQEQCRVNNQHLRFTEIDIEAERKSGRIAPDEIYVPQHTIDSNIRREQAKYISYIGSARRAAILHCTDVESFDSQIIEMDFTNRFRYDGWQLPLYRVVDGMQQNGYGVVELVMDTTKPGHLKFQDVGYGEFGYSLDTREIQSAEMIVRVYYFTKSQLLGMANSKTWQFSLEEVKKVVVASPEGEINDFKETSLYKVEKVLFRKRGIVYVGWSCQQRCDDWLRAPRPLYLGMLTLDVNSGQWVKAFETDYPFFIAKYNISENTILRQVKGRSYMDQDAQEAISSLVSSYATAHRRASGLYWCKDTENDPNNDTPTQTNNFFKPGTFINAKVKQFQLQAPTSDMLQAVQVLGTMNMQENSQIDYAANNRKDSRKTATEIQAAQAESQLLSTIQLALFSTFMKEATTAFFRIVRSRILGGMIADIQPQLKQMYQLTYQVKPAGDTDVIERQEKILRMQQTWPIIAQTAAGPIFLNKLLSLMFPEDAPLYQAAIQQDQQKTTVIASMLHVLQGLVMDPDQLTPQARSHIPELKQLMVQAVDTIQPQQGGGKGQQQQPQQLTQGQR